MPERAHPYPSTSHRPHRRRYESSGQERAAPFRRRQYPAARKGLLAWDQMEGANRRAANEPILAAGGLETNQDKRPTKSLPDRAHPNREQTAHPPPPATPSPRPPPPPGYKKP